MPRLSLSLAGLALLALFIPGVGIYLTMTFAPPAIVGGWIAYKDPDQSGSARLMGCSALLPGFLALCLAWAKWAGIQVVIDTLSAMI